MLNLDRNQRETITAFLMLLPAIVGLSLFLLLPAVSAAVLGFTNYILGPIDTHFVGLHNFIRMFADSTFVSSMLNTLYFAALVVPLQTLFALGLALLINRRMAGVNIFRAVYFFPTIMALVVISVVWSLLLNQGGVINGILGKVGIGPIPFLTSTNWAMPSIVIASVWQGAGLQMVIFLSGLQAIPKRLYEAAEIDGANPWQQFRYVTIPQLRPTILVAVVITTILSFRLFTQPFIMTRGGPHGSTRTIIMYIYNKGIGDFNLGYSSAMSFFLFLVVFAISLIQRKFLSQKR